MKALNTTLVLGPYDWHASVVPLAEFQTRLAATRRVLAEHGANALVVHGDTLDHGALTYLTGFTPKLGPALGIIPLEGEPELIFNGAGTMAESCRRLTWIEKLRPLGNTKQSLAAGLQPLAPQGKLVLAVWGGAAMHLRLYSALKAAASSLGRIVDIQSHLEGLRRHKSELEQRLLRRAGEILAAAIDCLRKETGAGAGVRTAALAAERHAYAVGAQDFRILASARAGGPPLPFDCAEDPRLEWANISVAVRYIGYWADAHVTLGADGSALRKRAEAGLATILNAARAGVRIGDLRKCADGALTLSGTGIGLSLEEGPCLSDDSATLEEGDVCSLKLEATDTVANVIFSAAVSALFVVRTSGVDVLGVGRPHVTA